MAFIPEGGYMDISEGFDINTILTEEVCEMISKKIANHLSKTLDVNIEDVEWELAVVRILINTSDITNKYGEH
jgi:xanthine dehydrogenase molybdopterin-binding subunit B